MSELTAADYELVAFDYERQQWVEGEAARPVLIKQLTQELVLLKGPKANEFVSSAAKYGRKMSVAAALAVVESKLAWLRKGAA